MKKLILLSLVINSFLFGALKDGVYRAETNQEAKGWKSFVELTVKNDKVVSVYMDEFNKDGEFKSKDDEYNEVWMEEGFDMNYPKAVEMVTKDFLEKQDPDKVDNIAGASGVIRKFKLLSGAALEHAQRGDTSKAMRDFFPPKK